MQELSYHWLAGLYMHLLDALEAAAELRGVLRGVVCMDDGSGDGDGARSATIWPGVLWLQGVVLRECKRSTMAW